MQQAYGGGDVTARPQPLAAADRRRRVRGLHAEGSDRRLDLGRGRLHPRERRPASAPIPSYLHTTVVRGDRLAAGRRLRAARRPLPGRPPSLRRSRRRPTASTGSMPRSCSTFRSCARTGSSRCAAACSRRSTTTIRCRTSCCRRSAAAARCAATAAGASAIATRAGLGRVAVDSQPPGARHGAVLRRRHGRAASRRDHDSSAFVTDYGIGVRFHGPARTPLRVELAQRPRGHAARVRGERGVLIMTRPSHD